MAVKVLLAENTAVLQRAIKSFLQAQDEVVVIEIVSDLPTAIARKREFQPDIVILNLDICDKDGVRLEDVRGLSEGPVLVAVTLGSDTESAAELAASIGASKMIDVMDLVEQLMPTIMELTPVRPS